jgi:hypothetical protein
LVNDTKQAELENHLVTDKSAEPPANLAPDASEKVGNDEYAVASKVDEISKTEAVNEQPIQKPAAIENSSEMNAVSDQLVTETDPTELAAEALGAEEEEGITGTNILTLVTPDMLVVALASFDAENEEQLSLVKGETYIRLTMDCGNGWSLGCTLDGSQTGVFPQTYCEQQTSPE